MSDNAIELMRQTRSALMLKRREHGLSDTEATLVICLGKAIHEHELITLGEGLARSPWESFCDAVVAESGEKL